MLVFRSNKFSWTKINDFHRATTQASTLGCKPGEVPSQFYIKSEKTGEMRLFLFRAHMHEGEDYLGSKYISPDNNLIATIFND